MQSQGRTLPLPMTRVNANPDDAGATLQTLRDLLRYAVTRFEAAGLSYGHGTGDSYDEAVWLLLWSLRLPPQRLEPFLDARLLRPEIDFAVQLVERRCAERLPAAYLTGEAWLHGLRFLSDPRALVPRSLIADALAQGLDDWMSEEPAQVLDLCTGGGSIAVLAALRYPQAQVTASDISTDALALAHANVELFQLGERIKLVAGDLFGGLAGRRYDLILCNPPYVNQASIDALPPEFRAEPPGALAGGVDGMDLVRRIIEQAPLHLNDGGGLLLEIGHEAAFFEAAFSRLEFAYLPVPAGDNQLVWVTRDQLTAIR
jgi:ribosomal protein L3 glutamine methyltransferase